jgi:hypothetical protein
MARIRSIKPEFFLHEKLYQAEKKTKLPLRVAFPGLWTVADREGRFKWKISELKLQILPHDRLDFEKVMQVLVDFGFVEKYEVDGKEYGFIPSWYDHQKIRPDEAKSVLPPPPTRTRVNPCGLVTNPSEPVSWKGRERKGKERKGEEGIPAQIEVVEDNKPPEVYIQQIQIPSKAIIEPYINDDNLKSKEEAFEYLKGNYLVIEETRKTISGKGWAAVDEVDVVGLIKMFVNAKAKLEDPPNEIRRHFKNWVFREPIKNLTDIAENFKKQLA